jgi:hypothetical protein
MENGEWWRHPETNMTWSNYTQCVNIQDLEVSEKKRKKKIDTTSKRKQCMTFCACPEASFIYIFFSCFCL